MVVDCGSVKDTDEVKWLRENKGSKSVSSQDKIQIYHRDKQGRRLLNQFLRDSPRREVVKNSSLVISDFNKEDVGVYHCQVCQSPSCTTITTAELILGKIFHRLWQFRYIIYIFLHSNDVIN